MFYEKNKEKKPLLTPKQRITICEGCDKFFSPTRQCKVCFCFMDIKTKIKSKTCPKGKW
mgnify:FL=1